MFYGNNANLPKMMLDIIKLRVYLFHKTSPPPFQSHQFLLFSLLPVTYVLIFMLTQEVEVLRKERKREMGGWGRERNGRLRKVEKIYEKEIEG